MSICWMSLTRFLGVLYCAVIACGSEMWHLFLTENSAALMSVSHRESRNWVLCTCEDPPGLGNHSPTVLRVTSLINYFEKFVLLDNDGYLAAKEISSIRGTQKLITVAAKSFVNAPAQYCSSFYFVRARNCVVLLHLRLGFCPFSIRFPI
jgi:hypothetical protein